MRVGVRDAGGFRKQHIAGARNVSRGVLELELDPAAPMPDPELAGKWDASIVVYCLRGAGSRSLAAADTLARMGYINVRQLAGGLYAWAESGSAFEADAE